MNLNRRPDGHDGRTGDGTATVQQVAVDVTHLPEAAQELALSEATVYLVIADLLDALEYTPPGASADEIHRRAGTRPASQTEVTRFHQQFGPFDSDSEG